MSSPAEADDVKLISSLFSAQKDLIDDVIANLVSRFGPPDWTSSILPFDRTRYYAREMGWPLYRRFISFHNLIRPEQIIDIKLTTNDMEGCHLADGQRRINIDPGYVSLERLILATGKNYTHRIYLSNGIYADLTLMYQKGSFRPLGWTYRDYADPEVIACFNHVREQYKRQLRGIPLDDEGGSSPRMNERGEHL
jgi:hypothetical protein